MSAPLAIASFFTIWWVALFAVLPFVLRTGQGSETHAGAPQGSDPGAPAAPRVIRTALWTTLVAGVIFAALDAYVIWLG
jgi:predicted secreted protein